MEKQNTQGGLKEGNSLEDLGVKRGIVLKLILRR
jgi:hypothetical protein